MPQEAKKGRNRISQSTIREGLRRAGLPSRRREGLPSLWVVPLLRAAVEHPAGCAPCSPTSRTSPRRLRAIQRPRHPE
jgi:hypothetical protein